MSFEFRFFFFAFFSKKFIMFGKGRQIFYFFQKNQIFFDFLEIFIYNLSKGLDKSFKILISFYHKFKPLNIFK